MIIRKQKENINEWIKNGKDALLVTGARQIGKTYLIRQCLQQSKLPYIEINFIENPQYLELFKNINSTKDFIMRFSLIDSEKYNNKNTIIFFDEVQECKDIVTRIKFLVEDGSFRYIMSGSLLGVELNDLRSAPVGYMSVINMYPLGFEEFIRANGVSNQVIDSLKNSYNTLQHIDSFIHEKLLDLFYLYLIIGGMPEAVATYLQTNDITKVGLVHKKIIDLYKTDFSKYEKEYKLSLREIYDSMAGQLNQENKRFKLNEIKNDLTFERIKNSFIWLKDAGVAIPVYNVTEPKLPLVINEKRNLFKLFFNDVGLLCSHYSNSVKIAILNKDKDINNGSLFENAVAQELLLNNFKLYYFNNKKQGELDFVVEKDGYVTPLEIKSGKNYKKHSALNNVLKDSTYNIKKGYIFCNSNICVENNRVYLPIYMIMFFKEKEIDNFIYKVDLSGLE